MNTQELMWNYAEGKCSPAEMAALEKLLSDDPTQQMELDQILRLQAELLSLQPDAPSMRFTRNVLDALPDIYPSEATDPLINPVWKKVFWLALAAMIAAVVLWPRSSHSSGSRLSSAVDQAVGSLHQLTGLVPDTVMQYFVLTLLSAGLLMLMDKIFLRKRGTSLLMI